MNNPNPLFSNLDASVEDAFERVFLAPDAYGTWRLNKENYTQEEFNNVIQQWNEKGKQQTEVGKATMKAHLRLWLPTSSLPKEEADMNFDLIARWENKRLIITAEKRPEGSAPVQAPVQTAEPEINKNKEETVQPMQIDGARKQTIEDKPPEVKKPKSRSTTEFGKKSNHLPLAFVNDSSSCFTRSGHPRPPYFGQIFMGIDEKQAHKYFTHENLDAMVAAYIRDGVLKPDHTCLLERKRYYKNTRPFATWNKKEFEDACIQKLILEMKNSEIEDTIMLISPVWTWMDMVKFELTFCN